MPLKQILSGKCRATLGTLMGFFLGVAQNMSLKVLLTVEQPCALVAGKTAHMLFVGHVSSWQHDWLHLGHEVDWEGYR